jgi:hypothetical protein
MNDKINHNNNKDLKRSEHVLIKVACWNLPGVTEKVAERTREASGI